MMTPGMARHYSPLQALAAFRVEEMQALWLDRHADVLARMWQRLRRHAHGQRMLATAEVDENLVADQFNAFDARASTACK